MFDTMVIATDGSASVRRAVRVSLDLAERFDATVHALYVIDAGDVETAPERLRDEMREALTERGEEALAEVQAETERDVTVAVREGRPAAEISNYAREVDADAVAMGTRGRHGESRFLIGSVAERVVRSCPVPVLTVRQLDTETDDPLLDSEGESEAEPEAEAETETETEEAA
ncbi:universal stress protein [Haloferax sp. S1W]|uniref:universal stress protein n=1 Tax=Haloferax sp. S1W TaxID=3377110 RepID=UPI0037C932DC